MKIDYTRGTDARTYLADLKFYRSIVRKLVEQADVNSEHVSRLKAAISKHEEPVKATAMTEDWCGDAACNLPILAQLFEEAGIAFSVFRGSEYPELEAYYNDMGIDHIPVISIWDGNAQELGRWVEQPAEVGPKKDAWKAERPEFMKLYERRKTDREAEKQFARLYRDLLEEMATWYTGGMWDRTTDEIVQLVE